MTTRQIGLHRDQITVLVHGLWMQGVLMSVMGTLLERRGFRTHSVSYDFLNHSPSENAVSLYREITSLGARQVNLVGHSLGGIVILHLMHQFPDLPVNKIVLIGSPVRGSTVAMSVYQNRLLRPLLGRSVERGLLGGAPEYQSDKPLGIITGKGKLGISSLLYPQGDDSDGVVRECETLVEKAADRVALPMSHSTMIFSRECTEYVARFLNTGSFREK